MNLTNHLVRRIVGVTTLCVMLFAVAAIAQAMRNIRVESLGARQIQLLTAGLNDLQTAPPDRVPEALARMEQLARSPDLRHVQFELRDAAGRLLAHSAPRYTGQATRRVGEWLALLSARSRRDDPPLSWTLTRLDGQAWQITLRPNLVSEQEEAAQDLIGVLVMLVLLSTALAIGTALGLRRAMRPVANMLSTLDQLGHSNEAARLAPSPIHEIDAVGRAINRLADSLAELEASRKSLSIRALSLQEDERAHFARELHDELGQKLTIIRMNAGYLQKTSTLDPEGQGALADIADATASIQQEVRELLGRLRPAGLGQRLDLGEFSRLLHLLVESWRSRPGQARRFTLDLRPGEPPVEEAILLALYRMTQEGLTNIAKHAQATQVSVSITREADSLVWQVRDDGQGIANMPSACAEGNGLVGMRERVWSLGGSFDVLASDEGTLLSASIPLTADAPNPSADSAGANWPGRETPAA